MVIPRSARVTSFSAGTIIDPLYLREAVEGMAARLAAQRITTEELAEARRIIVYQEEVWDNPDPGEILYRDANLAFHTLIIGASRNVLLAEQLRDDWHALSRMWRRSHPGHPLRGRDAIDDHRSIVEALERRDPDDAEIRTRRLAATSPPRG